MNKFATVIMAAAAATLLVTACSKGDSSQIKVGFAQVGAESDWRKANTESIKGEADKRSNIDLTFSDAQQKQENQISAIRTFITKGVDVISFSPIVKTGFEDVLKEAKEAGIPVVLFDRGVEVSEPGLYKCLIGSDFVEEGRRAARWVIENVGENANVAELVGTPGSDPAVERKKGFEEIIKDHPGIKIIKSQTGDFTRAKGKEVMESFLKSPEADQINVLFAHNDDMALGAIQAIEEAGKKPGKDIIIVSIDGVKSIFEAILAGKANCTVECNPIIGAQLFDVVEKIHAGETVPERVYSVESVYDSKNITQEVVDSRKY
ncbi:MAG: ABC transporter substrate-binding protein [Lentisphaeria bacterium]|jgi:simple sugar transport system substrate-binding protein|nr:ABC transporter substrate-binding protein [Lentisphaeria bacterium]